MSELKYIQNGDYLIPDLKLQIGRASCRERV